VRQKGTPLMQSRNRFLNEYESYRIINRLLELNSPEGRPEHGRQSGHDGQAPLQGCASA
jgi:hypothetical protein